MAESYYRWSPYNYSINNPVRFIDPDGNGVFDKVINAGKQWLARTAKEVITQTAIATSKYVVNSAKDAMGDKKLVAQGDITVSVGLQLAEQVTVDNKSVLGADVNGLSVDILGVETTTEFSSDGLSSNSEIDFVGKDGEVEGNTSLGGSVLATSGSIEQEYQLKDGKLNAQRSTEGGFGHGSVKTTKDLNTGEKTRSVGISGKSKFAVFVGLEVKGSLMLEDKINQD